MDSRLFWLALAAFVGATEGGLIAGILPSMSEDLGVTIGQAGMVMVGYAIAYAIGTPLLAVVLGGVGRRRILAWSEFGLAVSALLMAISPYFPLLVGVRTILAVCAGTFTGTAMATAAMIALPGERGRAIQIVTMGQSIAVLIGVPVGAYVAAHYSWRLNYAAIAAMAAAAALALYLRLPRGMQGDTQSMRDRIRVLGNPGVLPALLVTMLFMLSSFPLLIYVGALMREIGVARETLPLVLLASGIGAVVASLSAGRIADALGNRVTVAVSLLVVIVGLAAFALLPALPPESRLAALCAILAVQGYLGWAYWIAHCSEMAHLAPSSVQVAISLDMAALNIGMAIAAAAGGFVVDHWGAWALPYTGTPLAVVGLAVWLTMSKPKAS
jgi:MFS transporter, DHA1 family, inner membrane transport protein